MSILIRYASSQPLFAPMVYEDDDRMVDVNSIFMEPTSDVELRDDLIPKFFLVHSGRNDINQPNSSEPVRRANFWKRANFWRKRANFWRRDINP